METNLHRMVMNLPSEDGVETVSMAELLGVEDITLLTSAQTPYFTGTMGPEWDRANLQYFIHLGDRTGDYRLTVAATDMMDILLPRPQNLPRDRDLYMRTVGYVERAVQRAQLKRSLKLMNVEGIESDVDIYVPSKVTKPITFVPFELYNEFHRELLEGSQLIRGYSSNMFEVFKDDGMVR